MQNIGIIHGLVYAFFLKAAISVAKVRVAKVRVAKVRIAKVRVAERYSSFSSSPTDPPDFPAARRASRLDKPATSTASSPLTSFLAA